MQGEKSLVTGQVSTLRGPSACHSSSLFSLVRLMPAGGNAGIALQETFNYGLLLGVYSGKSRKRVR